MRPSSFVIFAVANDSKRKKIKDWGKKKGKVVGGGKGGREREGGGKSGPWLCAFFFGVASARPRWDPEISEIGFISFLGAPKLGMNTPKPRRFEIQWPSKKGYVYLNFINRQITLLAICASKVSISTQCHLALLRWSSGVT